jgi:hypothetical protein
MLKSIGVLVLSLVLSVFSNESNEDIGKELGNHCPYGSNEIHSNESIIGLSCVNLNCANESQFCRGSITCDSNFRTSCKSFESLLCQTDGIKSSSFKVCKSIPLETSTVSDSSDVIESSSEEKMPSRMKSLEIKSQDFSNKLNEGRINTYGEL